MELPGCPTYTQGYVRNSLTKLVIGMELIIASLSHAVPVKILTSQIGGKYALRLDISTPQVDFFTHI